MLVVPCAATPQDCAVTYYIENAVRSTTWFYIIVLDGCDRSDVSCHTVPHLSLYAFTRVPL